MNQYVKVIGYDSMYRDTSTGAIINRNSAEKISYEKRREAIKRQKTLEQRVTALESTMQNMNESINDIKNLLQQILTK